mgnify:CR=1 FL=1
MAKVYVVQEYACEDNYEGGSDYYSGIIGICDSEEAAKRFIKKMHDEFLRIALNEPLEYRRPVRYKEDDVTIGDGLDYNGYMYTEFELVQEIEKPE